MESGPQKSSKQFGLLLLLLILPFICIAPYLAIRYFVNYRAHIFDPSNPSAHSPQDGTIQYQGQTIQLSKAYKDFEEYKRDPMNIAPAETARVQQLLLSTRALPSYPDVEAMYDGMSQIQFPGYDMRSFMRLQREGQLYVFSIPIPRANQDRVIVYQVHEAKVTRLDDFVGPQDIEDVRLQGGQLIFNPDRRGNGLTRPLQ